MSDSPKPEFGKMWSLNICGYFWEIWKVEADSEIKEIERTERKFQKRKKTIFERGKRGSWGERDSVGEERKESLREGGESLEREKEYRYVKDLERDWF